MNDPIITALNAYRDAVLNRAVWQDHGSYGDGRLQAAVDREQSARRELLAAIREHHAKNCTERNAR